MKYFIPITAAAAIAVGGFVQAEPVFSTPSGYVTYNLVVGFNPIGFNLHLPAATNGTLTTVGATSVTDSSKDFTALLQAGQMYTLEITSANTAIDGLVTEVASWSGSQLNTSDNLTVPGVPAGTTYTLRKAATLSEIFGTSGSALNKANAIGNADVVYVPDGNGGYTQYHQRGNGDWRNATAGVFPVNNTPIVYLDGVFIERRSSTLNLVLTGTVKKTSTASMIKSGFNLISTMYPAGSTLQNLGFENTQLRKSNAVANADVVYVPNGTGGYVRYHMRANGDWRNADTGVFPVPTVPITSAVFIERGAALPTIIVRLTPPTPYADL